MKPYAFQTAEPKPEFRPSDYKTVLFQLHQRTNQQGGCSTASELSGSWICKRLLEQYWWQQVRQGSCFLSSYNFVLWAATEYPSFALEELVRSILLSFIGEVFQGTMSGLWELAHVISKMTPLWEVLRGSKRNKIKQRQTHSPFPASRISLTTIHLQSWVRN